MTLQQQRPDSQAGVGDTGTAVPGEGQGGEEWWLGQGTCMSRPPTPRWRGSAGPSPKQAGGSRHLYADDELPPWPGYTDAGCNLPLWKRKLVRRGRGLCTCGAAPWITVSLALFLIASFGGGSGGGGCEWRPVIKAGATLITPLVDSSLSESLKEEHLGDDQENLKERAVQLPST